MEVRASDVEVMLRLHAGDVEWIGCREDWEFLVRNKALPEERMRAVETGGCPHAAIREVGYGQGGRSASEVGLCQRGRSLSGK